MLQTPKHFLDAAVALKTAAGAAEHTAMAAAAQSRTVQEFLAWVRWLHLTTYPCPTSSFLPTQNLYAPCPMLRTIPLCLLSEPHASPAFLQRLPQAPTLLVTPLILPG